MIHVFECKVCHAERRNRDGAVTLFDYVTRVKCRACGAEGQSEDICVDRDSLCDVCETPLRRFEGSARIEVQVAGQRAALSVHHECVEKLPAVLGRILKEMAEEAKSRMEPDFGGRPAWWKRVLGVE